MLPIVQGLIEGDRRSLARAISLVDNNDVQSKEIINQIFERTGNAKTIGFTGPGGAGKSTLIGKLVPEFKSLGFKVAILAIDPTSPITGGAILGDRVRMQNTLSDESIFMRSMASRGATGGISASLRNAIRILDAAGYDLILVESVGAGQLEVEISNTVNITIVLFTPHTGDNIQAIKAGLTEIGDIYVVNKSDLDGSGSLYNSLLDLIGNSNKKPLVVKASSKSGRGIKEIAKAAQKMLIDREAQIKINERRLIEIELKEIVLNMARQKVLAMLEKHSSYSDLVDNIVRKKIDPYKAAENLIESILGGR